MMKIDNQKKPFNVTHEFSGSLSILGGQIVNDLHFIVDYSLDNKSAMSGKILGDNRTHERLFPVFMNKSEIIKLESDNKNIVIKSDDIKINKLRRIDCLKEEKESISFEVATLSLRNINITYESNKKPKRRKITFYLCGPDVIDIIFSQKNRKSKKTQSWYPEKSLLGTFRKSKVYSVRHIIKDNLNDDSLIEKEIIGLELQSNITEAELSNDAFVEFSKAVIDDVLLLTSFVIGYWVKWYGYLFELENKNQEYFRVRESHGKQTIDIEDLIINISQIKKFLRRAFRELPKYDKGKYDIKKSMIYLINGNEAEYTEAKFNTIFLSLEKLKDIYAEKKELDKNLKDGKFRKLHSKLAKLINKEIESAENIIAKLPELNRPPIQFIFNRILDEYDVEWKDLYPDNSELTIFKTRNSLFHSSRHPSFDTIIKDFYRLQILMNRILLKVLGWSEHSTMENKGLLKYLSK